MINDMEKHPLTNVGPLFGGDIRLQRIERVMKLIRPMTLAEMKAIYREIAQLHDAIVLANDYRWVKREDCGK